MKFVAGLLALSVFVAACADDPETSTDAGETSDASTNDESSGSNDESSAESSEDSAGAADGSATDDGTANDGTVGESTAVEDPATSDSSATTGDIPPFLQAFALGSGVEISDEIVQCLEDREVNLDASATAPTEEELTSIALGLFLCAPDQIAEAFAADIVPPPGADADDVECVVLETFNYLGTIPEDEALVLFESNDLPDDAQQAVVDRAEGSCDLDSDQIIAILEA